MPMSSNALIIERGIAEPPQITIFRCGSLRLFVLHVLQQHQPHRRHAGGVGDLLGRSSSS